MVNLNRVTTEEYSPPPFNPSIYSWSLHNIRATSNVLLLPMDDYEWQGYYIGLAVVPLALVLILLLWLFTLYVTACCNCRTSRRRSGGFKVFIFFCVLSLAGWIPVYVANVRTDQDLQSIANGLSRLSLYLNQVESAGKQTRVALQTLRADNVQLGTVCVHVINRSFPELDFPPYPTEEIEQVIDTADQLMEDKVATVSRQLNNVVTQFNSVYKDVIEARKVWTTVIATFMFIATLLFMVTTAYVFRWRDWPRAFKSNLESEECFLLGISRAACITVFSIVLLILTVCWLLCAIYQVISTVSSDICLPTPEVVLQRLLGQLSGSVLVNPDGCYPDPNGTQHFHRQFGREKLLQERPLADPTGAAFLVCYYQTCLGSNIIADTLEVANKVAQKLTPILNGYQEGIDELKAKLNETGKTDEEQKTITECVETFISLTLELTVLAVVAAGLISLAQCRNINELYVALLRDGLCNGVITNSVLLWSSFLAALLCLMIAMLLHRIFRLDQPKTETGFFPKHDSRSMFPDHVEPQAVLRTPDGSPNKGNVVDQTQQFQYGPTQPTSSDTIVQEGPPGTYKVVLT